MSTVMGAMALVEGLRVDGVEPRKRSNQLEAVLARIDRMRPQLEAALAPPANSVR